MRIIRIKNSGVASVRVPCGQLNLNLIVNLFSIHIRNVYFVALSMEMSIAVKG